MVVDVDVGVTKVSDGRSPSLVNAVRSLGAPPFLDGGFDGGSRSSKINVYILLHRGNTNKYTFKMSLETLDATSPPRFLLLLPPPPPSPTFRSLKSAYGETLSEVLQEVALHSPESPRAAVLEIAWACPHLLSHRQKSRASLYSQTQSLLAALYKLITVIATQGDVNVENEDGVDVRIILIAWSPESSAEEPSPSPYGPIIDLPTLARSGRLWQFAFGVETDDGEKLVRAFVAAKSVPEDNATLKNPPSTSPPSGAPQNDLHHNVAVGGTWDHLHIGHKLLLTMTLFSLDPRISSKPFSATIGITGDSLLTNKSHAKLLESWMDRQKSVASFCESIIDFSSVASSTSPGSRQVSIRDDAGPNGKGVDVSYPHGLVVKCTEIQDPFGPTITEQEIDALIVSGETRKGGEAVNEKRKELGWKELKVFEVDVLDADEEEKGNGVKEGFEGKLSSSSIRERLGRRNGGKI